MATGAPEFQGALVRLADALAREAKKVSTALARLDQADALDGSARRQLFNQARETVLNNAEEEPGTKWIRHPINLWYCSEAKAREVMSEEMANWFDANGRITLPVMRAMILDGDENFRRRTIMTQDFNQ